MQHSMDSGLLALGFALICDRVRVGRIWQLRHHGGLHPTDEEIREMYDSALAELGREPFAIETYVRFVGRERGEHCTLFSVVQGPVEAWIRRHWELNVMGHMAHFGVRVSNLEETRRSYQ